MTDTAEVTLRPYQAEALGKTVQAETVGIRRQLGVAATGLGKTIMFAALARQRGGRTLVLAHRDELVQQAAAKIREVWPGVDVGICKAQANEVTARVVVASVQTLANPKRLARLTAPWSTDTLLGKADPFDLVVVDEAHHATADSYRMILDGLHAGDPNGPLLLGVTATPDRGDGKGLNDLFDEIVWSYDVLWGIAQGFLSDLRGVRVRLEDLNMAKVKTSRGDYDAGAAGRALEDAQAPDVAFAAWSEHAQNRRTLVFTPTVHLAEAMADRFRTGGIAAAAVSGGTPLDERRRILRDYAAGQLQVVANCAVLTEGFDEPRTDCILVARPTKSRALYTQMIGRGTRRHPDKGDCLVLDIVGATLDHSLLTIPSLFGIEDGPGFDGAGMTVSQAVRAQSDDLVRLGRITAEEANLFAAVRSTNIAWIAVHDHGDRRRYERPLGDRNAPRVILAEGKGEYAGQWVAAVRYPDRRLRVLHAAPSMELTQGIAEDFIRHNAPAAHLVLASAPWRNKVPSPKALAAAKKWRLKVDPKWSAGELSDALDAHIARRRNRSKRRAG